MMKKYFLSGVRNDDDDDDHEDEDGDEDEDDEEDDDSRANNFYKLYAHMPTLQARQTREQAKRSDRLENTLYKISLFLRKRLYKSKDKWGMLIGYQSLLF